MALLEFLGQATIVVIGWGVVNELSKRRELAKSRRELAAKELDASIEEVSRLISQAHSYHTSEARVSAIENELVMAFQDLSHRIGALPRVLDNQSHAALCRSRLLDFKRACTGDHFADEHNGPLEADSPALQRIASTGITLKRELAQLKLDQFSMPSALPSMHSRK